MQVKQAGRKKKTQDDNSFGNEIEKRVSIRHFYK